MDQRDAAPISDQLTSSISDIYHKFPVGCVTLQVGTDSVAAAQMDKTMRYFLRAMPIFMLPFIAKFPAVRTVDTPFIHVIIYFLPFCANVKTSILGYY